VNPPHARNSNDTTNNNNYISQEKQGEDIEMDDDFHDPINFY
jgi:hypothetical protein